MAILPERLKELRKAKGVTQKDVADYLGIAERNYRRYEAGGVDPHTSATIALSDYFDVSIEYLIGRSDNPNRQ